MKALITPLRGKIRADSKIGMSLDGRVRSSLASMGKLIYARRAQWKTARRDFRESVRDRRVARTCSMTILPRCVAIKDDRERWFCLPVEKQNGIRCSKTYSY